MLAALTAASALSACLPPDPGPDGLYRGMQADITPVVTPQGGGVRWGDAPVIDPNYGGTIYPGTGGARPDPRPAATNGLQPLRYWLADPADGRTDRPAIVWIHGGGFAAGLGAMYPLAAGTGADYARRGYVSFSVEYRINTTLVGTKALCQWVQDNIDPNDPVWQARKDTCRDNQTAAQRDVLAFVRYLRANATTFGIDPDEIAVAGFSAGAVTASNVAFQWDDVGTTSYFTGDSVAALDSRPRAVIGASGCTPNWDSLGAPPPTVDVLDVPTSFIASRYDQAVDYSCSAASTQAARDAGIEAQLTSYCNEGYHAADLYEHHKPETDEQWTTFLVRRLGIYSGLTEPAPLPLCP